MEGHTYMQAHAVLMLVIPRGNRLLGNSQGPMLYTTAVFELSISISSLNLPTIRLKVPNITPTPHFFHLLFYCKFHFLLVLVG